MGDNRVNCELAKLTKSADGTGYDLTITLRVTKPSSHISATLHIDSAHRIYAKEIEVKPPVAHNSSLFTPSPSTASKSDAKNDPEISPSTTYKHSGLR